MKGVRVDVEKANQLKLEFQNQEKEYLQKIKQLVGKDIDIWAARQIGEAYDRLGLDYPRTEKTQEPSFTANWLANSKHDKIATITKIESTTSKLRLMNLLNGSSIGILRIEIMGKYP